MAKNACPNSTRKRCSGIGAMAKASALWTPSPQPQQPPTLTERYAFAQWLMQFPALTVMVFLRRDLGFRLLNPLDRKSTRLNSSHLGISYAVFCLKKKK